MEEKENRGGKRLGAGRKPSANKKIPVTLYVEKKAIWPFGNEPKMKEKLMEFIDGYAIPIVAAPKEVYDSPPLKISCDEPLKFSAPQTVFKSFEWYRIAKKDIEVDEDWQVLKAEIEAAPNLSSKQKTLLTTTNI